MPLSGGQVSGVPPLSQTTGRSGWLGGLMPVRALEDNLSSLGLDGAEMGEEVEEEGDDKNGTDEEENFEDFWKCPLTFDSPRHLQPIVGEDLEMQSWRPRDRMKTVSVALVICLNVGVDPPDVIKTQPCARKECWIDPLSLNPQKALETIGNTLQRQYERWQPKARYRQNLDPTLDDVRRLATALRRSAREERVLFHYNGHGVPKPTTNGEIWVFNRSYTQYIPLSIYDLQTWMGAPSIYVYDCNNAGIIVESFKTFAEQHEKDYAEQMRNIHNQGASTEVTPPMSLRNCIQLAACSANELLPMSPDLPADLFTSCLTTPIKVALRWFVMRHERGHLGLKVTLEQLDKIPGQFTDRRTMLGELNWIFTAITDTIAWNTLPRETFQKLFRQDLLVASLFRNFLLAERILRACDCTPVSHPPLPHTHQHSMWEAWDMAVDACLSQLPDILEKDKSYVPSIFFEEQLTAFEVWLSHGCESRSPPEQLPIVLQVLLSQAHRLRALDLLGRFLDLGPWAVNLVLSVGIYPYVLKLLQANARELRPLLVFLWAKILAVDTSCQQDLVRDQSHRYFLAVLQDAAMLPQHKTWSVFVLSCVVHGYKKGQEEALAGNLITICLNELDESDPVLRQWLAICLGRIWDKNEEARWRGARDNAPERLFALLSDETPEVRAAAVYALGTFLNSCSTRTDHADTLDQTIALKLLKSSVEDGSPLVRRELVVALQWIIFSFTSNFVNLCKALHEEEGVATGSSPPAAWLQSPRHGKQSSEERKKVEQNNKQLRPDMGSRHGTSNNMTSASYSEISTLGLGEEAQAVVPSRKQRKVLLNQVHGSYSSITSFSVSINKKFKPFLLRVWAGLLLLEKDSDPTTTRMARTLLDIVWKKMCDKERVVEMYRLSNNSETHSHSAPNSPMRPTFMLGGESPPTLTINSTMPGDNFSRSLASAMEEEPMLSVMYEDGESGGIISTQFIDWSSRYFSTQLMRLNDTEDKESNEYWEKEWMYERNRKELRKAAAEQWQLKSLRGKLDDQLAVLRVTQPSSSIAVHPYSGEVVSAGRDTITAFELGQSPSPQYYSFCNRNPRNTLITALELINDHEEGLLAAGSDDGVVRVYSKWARQEQMLASWNFLPELVPVAMSGNRFHVGLCMAWDQYREVLAGGGDQKFVRLWDCNTEVKKADLPTGTNSFISSMSTSDHMLVASHGDGSVRVYDPRLSPNLARVMTYREHLDYVLCCKGHANNKLTSGCRSGVIKTWDIRRQASVSTVKIRRGCTTMDIHKTAPVFAVWASDQLCVYNLNGRLINQIRYYDGILGQRLGAVNYLKFHPRKLQLASGSLDYFISVHGYKKGWT